MSSNHTPTDVKHRAMMNDALSIAAEHFSLSRAALPVFGWEDRTIACKAKDANGVTVWLRVSSQLKTWAYGDFWEGNKEAEAVVGVPKPTIVDVFDWSSEDRFFRAEVMTYVHQDSISGTPEIHYRPQLAEQWWNALLMALDALSKFPTGRVHLDQVVVTRRLREYFGDRVDPTVDFWVTSHNDLHWANLTQPKCVLLDWESWGVAPFGYDAATLYCHSLLVPELAREVHGRFKEELQTPDGTRSLLLVIARMLKRSGQGEYPELVGPLHKIADELTGR